MYEQLDITNDTNFESDVIKHNGKVLLYLCTSWCGPCEMMAPMVRQVAGEIAEQVKVIQLDIEQCPKVSALYNWQQVPAFCLFEGGDSVRQHFGALTKNQLLKFVTPF